MPAVTTQILVGKDPISVLMDGYRPSHALYLWQHESPMDKLQWAIMPTGLGDLRAQGATRIIAWNTTMWNVVEDAILLIGLYIERIPAIVELASKFVNLDALEVDVSALTRDQRKALDQLCREADFDSHIAVTILAESWFQDMWCLLQPYRISMEVCAWRYAKVTFGTKPSVNFHSDDPFLAKFRRN